MHDSTSKIVICRLAYPLSQLSCGYWCGDSRGHKVDRWASWSAWPILVFRYNFIAEDLGGLFGVVVRELFQNYYWRVNINAPGLFMRLTLESTWLAGTSVAAQKMGSQPAYYRWGVEQGDRWTEPISVAQKIKLIVAGGRLLNIVTSNIASTRAVSMVDVPRVGDWNSTFALL